MFQDTEPFDLQRALLRDDVKYRPFHPTPEDTFSLSELLAQGKLAESTHVLVFTAGGVTLALSTVQMIYHHVAQGTHGGTDWMMSFCVICNAGLCFSPVVEGRTLHFVERGLYNAMTVVGDLETGSIWHHLSGRCFHGAMMGKRLAPLAAPRQMTAAQAQAQHPDARLLLSSLLPDEQAVADRNVPWRLDRRAELPANLSALLSREDTRVPRLELGLGVWNSAVRRFYPISTLFARDNAVIDTFGTERLLVYVDEGSNLPGAVYTQARSATWRGGDLLLDTGEMLRRGMVYDAQGKPVPSERPMQLFQRWYSFAAVFPGVEVFGL